MHDSVTITREWMMLLRSLPTERAFVNVLSAVADYAMDGKDADGLSEDEMLIFRSIKKAINARKRKRNYITKVRKQASTVDPTKPSTVDVYSRRPDDLFSVSSNQHINTFKPLSCESKDSLCSPKGERKKKFTPPTLDDVKQYIRMNGYSIDPEEFFSFYESQGWKVGKNPMKDWHRAVSYWQCRQNNRFKTPRQLRDYSGI